MDGPTAERNCHATSTAAVNTRARNSSVESADKIKLIERVVKDALLNVVIVVRTKYVITIASQYPVRHIQH